MLNASLYSQEKALGGNTGENRWSLDSQEGATRDPHNTAHTRPHTVFNKTVCLERSVALNDDLDLIRINGPLGANGSSLGREGSFPRSLWKKQFSKWCLI